MTKAIKKAELAAKDSKRERFSNWEAPELSPERQAEIEVAKQEVMARPNRPHMRVTNQDGKYVISLGTEDPGSDVLNSVRFYDVSSSASNQFVGNLLLRLMDAVKLTGDDERDSTAMGAAVALIAAVDPQNELETTMALQMVAANEAALGYFGRARRAEYIEHATAFSNMANKAMRSFALHAEAIAKLRRGGEQVVKHVHVNEGGQAVIAGTVNTGGGG